jgi:hypothetical protein
MSKELAARLRAHIQRHDGKGERLFVNLRGRPFSANKLREKQLHPPLDALKTPRGGFHWMRHGAASSLLADGTTPAVFGIKFAARMASRPELNLLADPSLDRMPF